MTLSPHVMFTGGGYAGQIVSALAVAEQVERLLPQATITFAGPGHSFDRHFVRQAGYNFVGIPSYPLPRTPLDALRFVTDNIAGYCTSRWLLAEQQVNCVVGYAGYAAATIMRAAITRGIPSVLLETNAIPCLTTRWLGRSVNMLCASFEEVQSAWPSRTNIRVTGVPVASSFATMPGGIAAAEPRRLVVLGGRAAARQLNESVPAAIGRVKERLRDWSIVHQTGDGQLEQVRREYEQHGVKAVVVGQLDDAGAILRGSEIAISRGGGIVLGQLAASGTPGIVLPFVDAPDDHQSANARIYQQAGAIRVVDEERAGGRTDVEIAAHLEALIGDATLRSEMAAAMRKLARPNAAEHVAAVIAEVTGAELAPPHEAAA